MRTSIPGTVLVVSLLCACGASRPGTVPAAGSADGIGAAGPVAAAAPAGEESDEVRIDLASVPEAAVAGAKSAVPGIAFTRAEKETEGGVLVYCLVGTAGGKTIEVEVTADGKVLEIENEDDGEDDADDDDDDDDDRAGR